MTAINDQQRKAVRNKIPRFFAFFMPDKVILYLFKNMVDYSLNDILQRSRIVMVNH